MRSDSSAYIEGLVSNLRTDSVRSVGRYFALPLFSMWLLALVLYGVLVIFMLGIRLDIQEHFFSANYLLEFGLCVLVVASAIWTAITLSIPNADRNYYLAASKTVFLVGSLCLLFVVLMTRQDAFFWVFSSWHISLRVTLLSLIPMAIGIFFIKQLAPVRLHWVAWLVGIASTITAHTILRLHLPNSNLLAIFTWCFAPAVILSLMASKLLALFLRW